MVWGAIVSAAGEASKGLKQRGNQGDKASGYLGEFIDPLDVFSSGDGPTQIDWSGPANGYQSVGGMGPGGYRGVAQDAASTIAPTAMYGDEQMNALRQQQQDMYNRLQQEQMYGVSDAANMMYGAEANRGVRQQALGQMMGQEGMSPAEQKRMAMRGANQQLGQNQQNAAVLQQQYKTGLRDQMTGLADQMRQFEMQRQFGQAGLEQSGAQFNAQQRQELLNQLMGAGMQQRVADQATQQEWDLNQAKMELGKSMAEAGYSNQAGNAQQAQNAAFAGGIMGMFK